MHPNTIREGSFWTESYEQRWQIATININNHKIWLKKKTCSESIERHWNAMAFGLEDAVSMVSKNDVRCWFVWPQYSFNFYTDFQKFSWAYAVIYAVIPIVESCLFVMHGCLIWRSQASNFGFWPCPWHTEVSPASWNLLMTWCITNDEMFKVIQSFMLSNIILKSVYNW